MRAKKTKQIGPQKQIKIQNNNSKRSIFTKLFHKIQNNYQQIKIKLLIKIIYCIRNVIKIEIAIQNLKSKLYIKLKLKSVH